MFSANPRNVPRLANLIDLGGVALLVIGAGCYLRAYLGMMALRVNGASSTAPGSGLAEYEFYWRLSRWGLWIGVAAAAVLVAGAVVAWRARRARAIEPVTATVAL